MSQYQQQPYTPAPEGAYPAPESAYPAPPVPPGHGSYGSHGSNRARNGMGVAALILGIIGTASGVIPFLFWLAGVLGLISLILGLAGRGRAKRGEATNKGVTTTGAVLGLLAMILAVVGAVITFKAVGDAVKELDGASASVSSAPKATGAAGAGKGADNADTNDKPADKALEAGDSAVYDDDVTVTVSAPTSYAPDSFAAGHTKGDKAYKVTVVIENAGKEKFDSSLVTTAARAGAEGVTAEEIFDGTVGTGFSGQILPGKKATVEFAFDTPPGAKSLTVEITPSFSHDLTQWELKL